LTLIRLISKLFNKCSNSNKGEKMTRDEAIQAGKQSLDQAQADALGAAFDAGVASVPAQPPSDGSGSGGGFTQADIDQAIAKVVADDQAHFQELQSKIDLDAQELSAVKASVAQALQAALALVGQSQP
jgi:hypothetical protein